VNGSSVDQHMEGVVAAPLVLGVLGAKPAKPLLAADIVVGEMAPLLLDDLLCNRERIFGRPGRLEPGERAALKTSERAIAVFLLEALARPDGRLWFLNDRPHVGRPESAREKRAQALEGEGTARVKPSDQHPRSTKKFKSRHNRKREG
jgi:hypothetical protein